jgi:hypothetical protein
MPFNAQAHWEQHFVKAFFLPAVTFLSMCTLRPQHSVAPNVRGQFASLEIKTRGSNTLLRSFLQALTSLSTCRDGNMHFLGSLFPYQYVFAEQEIFHGWQKWLSRSVAPTCFYFRTGKLPGHQITK